MGSLTDPQFHQAIAIKARAEERLCDLLIEMEKAGERITQGSVGKGRSHSNSKKGITVAKANGPVGQGIDGGSAYRQRLNRSINQIPHNRQTSHQNTRQTISVEARAIFLPDR